MVRCVRDLRRIKQGFCCDVASGTVLLGGCVSFVMGGRFDLLVDLSNSGRKRKCEMSTTNGGSFSQIVTGVGLLQSTCPRCFGERIVFGSMLRGGGSIRAVFGFVGAAFKGRPSVSPLGASKVHGSGIRRFGGACGDFSRDVRRTNGYRMLGGRVFVGGPRAGTLLGCVCCRSNGIF